MVGGVNLDLAMLDYGLLATEFYILAVGLCL